MSGGTLTLPDDLSEFCAWIVGSGSIQLSHEYDTPVQSHWSFVFQGTGSLCFMPPFKSGPVT